MGQFFQREWSSKFGFDLHISVSDENLSRCRDYTTKGLFRSYLGQYNNINACQMIHFARGIRRNNQLIDAQRKTQGWSIDNLDTTLQMQPGNKYLFLNDKACRVGEMPGAAIYGTARGMAKFGAFMANKGTLNGQTLLDETTWSLMHLDHKTAVDAHFGNRVIYTLGGICLYSFDSFNPRVEHPTSTHIPQINNIVEQDRCLLREGFYGWHGAGGSILQWHPELGISVAYLPFDLIPFDLTSKRAGLLQKLVTDVFMESRAENTSLDQVLRQEVSRVEKQEKNNTKVRATAFEASISKVEDRFH